VRLVHLGGGVPSCILLSRRYTGQNKRCMSFWSSFDHSPVNCSQGLSSLSRDLHFVVLNIAAACGMAKCQSSAVMVLSHLEIA
jgi:hypothetical protein